MATILAIDDEKDILNLIRRILSRDGHLVETLSDSAAVEAARPERFDLILLDVMMPGMDGFALCEMLRERVDCPILFLTAKTDESSLVCGLGAGGDDYICKPFGAAELRARVNAHLRREQREHAVRLVFGNIVFHLRAKQLMVDGSELPLTRGEYRICELLARNPGQVFSREQIYENVFGFDGESSDSTIATHIKNIRMKLEQFHASPIRTVWGIGYKWEP
ncbi:response regulator transcription factor [Lachnospiraceae bacterium 47-T17]